MKTRIFITLLLIYSFLAMGAKPPMKTDGLVVAEKDVTTFFDKLDEYNKLLSIGLGDTSVAESKLKDGSVTNDKLGTNAVTAPKIAMDAINAMWHVQNRTVVTDNLASNAVTEEKVEDGAITNNKLGTNSVTTEKINALAVTSDKLNDAAVTEDKVANDAITHNKLADNAVRSSNIYNYSVLSDHIQYGAIHYWHFGTDVYDRFGFEGNMNINPDDLTLEIFIADDDTIMRVKDGGISSEKLANSSVTSDKLASNAITSAKIPDGTITEEDIGNYQVTEDKIDIGAVTTNKIRNQSITSSKLDSGAVINEKIAPGAVTTDKISDLQITTPKIADEAITHDKLDEDAVTTPKIVDRNVTEAKLADAAVVTRVIKDSTILREDLSPEVNDILNIILGSVYGPDDITLEIHISGTDTTWRIKPGGVSATLLASDAVTTEKIVNDAVDSTKVAEGAVTSTGIKDSTILMKDLNREVLAHIFASDSVVYLGEKIFFIPPGEDIQAVIDSLEGRANDNWYTLLLGSGRHTITSTIRLYPFITLMGLGDPSDTQVYCDMDSGMVRADSGNVVIKNLEFYNACILYEQQLGHVTSPIACVQPSSMLNNLTPVVLENLKISYLYYQTTEGSAIYFYGYFDQYLDRKSRIKDCYIV